MGSIGWRYYAREEISFRVYPASRAFVGSILEALHGYQVINADDQLRFETWILNMRDGSGMGCTGRLAWLYRHAMTYRRDRPWTTLIAFDRADNRILGTASFVSARDYDEPSSFGVWDFVNVSLELHGHGIGTLICTEINEHIQREANKRRKEQIVNLSTANEGARSIYHRLGFRPAGSPLAIRGMGTYHSLTKAYQPLPTDRPRRSSKREKK